MSVYRLLVFFLFHLAFLSSLPSFESSASPPLCPRSELGEVANDLRSQCPNWTDLSLPEEVHSDTLDNELAQIGDGEYLSVLFHASWCPFSRNVKPIFDSLTSMFPLTRHLTVEESSAVSSAFSRHGIHGFPSILLASRTARIIYDGPKDLVSLVRFYRKSTGQEPVTYLYVDQTKEKRKFSQPWPIAANELLKNEPYLAFSLLFVVFRAFTFLFPHFISQLIAFFWMSSALRHVNLGILSERSQLLGRFLHVIDIKGAWSKLRRSNKTRNFHRGAKSAREWASSLASVSLGESSSSWPTRSG
ncbi:5'-adenylylsulfate reductase-like 5 [Platanthera zijinensis]|uniref:5'-adenylylsulfate reductase-like 5 n=1 Tax=Platanthera zijinensis TaxID=2320716 RepID=A0AAP0BFQ3_9ASPA